jgi:uncharacterized protein (DUF2141 family)
VIVFYLISLVSYSQTSNKIKSKKEPHTYQVTAQINNVSSDKGKVYFVLYNNEEGFISKNYFKGEISEIQNGVASVVFSGLKPSTYAIVCFHDANNNGEMDFEANGMPLEDYGISNNVMNYGPPQFADAKFELKDKDLTFDIKL